VSFPRQLRPEARPWPLLPHFSLIRCCPPPLTVAQGLPEAAEFASGQTHARRLLTELTDRASRRMSTCDRHGVPSLRTVLPARNGSTTVPARSPASSSLWPHLWGVVVTDWRLGLSQEAGQRGTATRAGWSQILGRVATVLGLARLRARARARATRARWTRGSRAPEAVISSP
jgi:hypothetical protein